MEQRRRTTGSTEPVTPPKRLVGTPDARRRRGAPRLLRLLISVAAVVLALDVVTKVLAVKLLPPGQPVSIIGDLVTWTWSAIRGRRSRWPPDTPGC